MKLLIVTQAVDRKHPILGFFHEWLSEFSKKFERVTIICLQKGEYDLPENVRVLSLGKESGVSRFGYVMNFYRYILSERSKYDRVFVHMNPIYVVLGGPVWKIFSKKISLWYVHRHVDLKLRIAHTMADQVLSAVPESFRIKSAKIRFLGQAVPLELYKKPDSFFSKSDVFTILFVGRITPIKNLETLVEAAAILREKNIAFHLDFVGEPVTESDQAYKKKILNLISQKKLQDSVTFVGGVSNADMPLRYWKSDLSINLSPTGGLDKAVLESMASGTPVMVSNLGFKEYFEDMSDRMMFKENDAKDLALKIEAFIKAGDKEGVVKKLLKEVEARSSLQALIGRIYLTLS